MFRWYFRRRLLGLCKCFCHHFLFQRARRAISLGPYRTFGAPRSFHCCSGVVFQFVGPQRVCVGVFTQANKATQRYHSVSAFLRSRHRLFCRRYGLVPTSLSRHLSQIVAPASSLSVYTDTPAPWSALKDEPPRMLMTLNSLSPEHGERNSPACRFVCFFVGRRKVLVQRPIRDAIKGIRDSRQLIDELVAHRRPLQNHGTPPAELLHRPSCRRNGEQDDRQQLFVTCDGDRAAKEMIYMIREQFFLPAGAILENYTSIGCLFARRRQWKSPSGQKCVPSRMQQKTRNWYSLDPLQNFTSHHTPTHDEFSYHLP